MHLIGQFESLGAHSGCSTSTFHLRKGSDNGQLRNPVRRRAADTLSDLNNDIGSGTLTSMSFRILAQLAEEKRRGNQSIHSGQIRTSGVIPLLDTLYEDAEEIFCELH